MAACCRLKEASSGRVLIPKLEVANTFWKRFNGLQFRSGLPTAHGLLLAPCGAIHTMCMRFAIDVAFLDGQGRVLKVRSSVQPWRILPPVHHARAVLETAAGELAMEAGLQVCLEPLSELSRPLPSLLQGWLSSNRD